MNIKKYKTPSGKTGYVASSVYIGTDSLTGKQVKTTIRGRTKKDVNIKLERLKNDFITNDNTLSKPKADTIADIVTLWYDYFKMGKAPRTIHNTDALLKHYILPAFGKYQVEKLNTVIIQNQVNQWAMVASQPLNGRHQRTVGHGRDFQKYFSLTSKILDYAISQGVIKTNPCTSVLLPKARVEPTEKETKFLTKPELETFFNYLETTQTNQWQSQFLLTLCRLLVASGLRIGEALALNWSDINFNKSTLTVNKTTTLKQMIKNSPKTSKSNRTIILDDKAMSYLKKWEIFVKKNFMKIANPNQPLVFPKQRGGVVEENNYNLRLKRLFNNAGVPDVGFHGFRHTHASLCFAAGMTPKVVQLRLGHSSIKTTLDIYTHIEMTTAESELELFSKYANF